MVVRHFATLQNTLAAAALLGLATTGVFGAMSVVAPNEAQCQGTNCDGLCSLFNNPCKYPCYCKLPDDADENTIGHCWY